MDAGISSSGGSGGAVMGNGAQSDTKSMGDPIPLLPIGKQHNDYHQIPLLLEYGVTPFSSYFRRR